MARKKVAEVRVKTPNEILIDTIPQHTKEAFAKAVMDDPNGYYDEKIEFLEKFGFPLPPPRAVLNAWISVEVPDGWHDTSAGQTALEKQVAETLEAAGVVVYQEEGGVSFEWLANQR